MMGQLKIVHERKKLFSLTDGAFNYKDCKWTENNAVLYALYYLGISSINFSSFANHNGKILSKIDYEFLKPTYFPPKKEDREPGDD